MALSDDIAALPDNPVGGQVGINSNIGTLNRGMKAHEAELLEKASRDDLTVEIAQAKAEADQSYAPLWQPSTAYALNAPVLLPAPVSAIGKRTTAGTSRASFDATEQALWTVTAGGITTVEGLTDATTLGKALATAPDAPTARNAIGAGDAPTVAASDLRRRFAARAQRNTPQHQIAFAGKANTAAGVVPTAFDTPFSNNPVAINNGAAGAALRVTDGFLTFAPTAAGAAAGYLTGVADGPITVMGARWKWDNSGGRTGTGPAINLTITATQMTAFAAPFTDAGVHLVVTPTLWQLDYITGGAGSTITNITSGSFAFSLARDNFTEHEVQLFRNGNTVRILLPDGSIVGPITNANIDSKSGNAFWVEPFATNGNADPITAIRDIWVGTGGVIAPTQQAVTRKTMDQLAAWEPVIKGMYPTSRAVGQASMPLYITSNRRVGAVVYFLGTADASGSMTVELRANNATIPGTSVTIAAGQVQGVASGPFTFITGQKITIHVTAVGGTPGIGIDAQMLRE